MDGNSVHSIEEKCTYRKSKLIVSFFLIGLITLVLLGLYGCAGYEILIIGPLLILIGLYLMINRINMLGVRISHGDFKKLVMSDILYWVIVLMFPAFGSMGTHVWPCGVTGEWAAGFILVISIPALSFSLSLSSSVLKNPCGGTTTKNQKGQRIKRVRLD